MKKKIIILISIFLIVLFLILGTILFKDYLKEKRYEELRKDIEKEALEYLKISHPYCTPGSGDFVINEEALLYQWGMDKEKLLDVDKESYCKTRIEATCVSVNKLGLDVYISCKEYEDENYSNWEYRD